MEPNAFVAEVYRRMSVRHAEIAHQPSWEEIKSTTVVIAATHHYSKILPTRKDAAILDIGFGGGWFMAACLNLGYTNISGAEFNAEYKKHILHWSPSIKEIYNVDTTIADLLSKMPDSFDFIHLSHVIEHIPKYSLLYIVDSIYMALKKDGVVLLRTPNMEGPCSPSSYFVTLGHEYGFCGSNLMSLLDICNFENVRIHNFDIANNTMKQYLGILLRWPILKWNAMMHRLFGVNRGGNFGQELIVSAKRGNRPPLFNEKYK